MLKVDVSQSFGYNMFRVLSRMSTKWTWQWPTSSSSCVWDLLLYYFTELPQPIHGFRARVGQVSGGAQRWSEPGALWQDVVRLLLRSATQTWQTGCWGAEAPAVHVGAETTDSSAEAVQGDPLSAREIGSWWDVCTREDGELCRLYRLLPIMFPLLH